MPVPLKHTYNQQCQETKRQTINAASMTTTLENQKLIIYKNYTKLVQSLKCQHLE